MRRCASSPASDACTRKRTSQACRGHQRCPCELYGRVFSQPPFRWTNEESGHHRELLTSLRQEPSFGIATAQTNTGQLAGFGYGYALRPDAKWWRNFLEPLPDDLAEEWPGRTFALIDLAVAEDPRGHGLGRQLTEILLTPGNGRLRSRRSTSSWPPTAGNPARARKCRTTVRPLLVASPCARHAGRCPQRASSPPVGGRATRRRIGRRGRHHVPVGAGR